MVGLEVLIASLTDDRVDVDASLPDDEVKYGFLKRNPQHGKMPSLQPIVARAFVNQ